MPHDPPATDRIGDWMQTFTGKAFYPLDPKASDVCIEDIAHALSMMCRYGGHSVRFYSVAEHSVHVSWNVPSEDALWGLLHDSAEAYCGDMIRPMKRFIPEYEKAEAAIMLTICERFGLTLPMPEMVKYIDNAILGDEKDAVLAPCAHDWGLRYPRLGATILGLAPSLAETLFLNRFAELTKWKENVDA